MFDRSGRLTQRSLTYAVAVASILLSAMSVRPVVQENSTEAPAAKQPGATTDLDNSFIGSSRCVTCHREQAGSWAETAHALAFDHLPEKYRSDGSCLKCHTTGYGEDGGFNLEMSEEEAMPLLSVGCESCHGPGARHQQAVDQWTLASPAEEAKWAKEIKDSITRIPIDSQCAECHVGQAHQVHPPYDGQPAVAVAKFHGGQKTTSANMVLPPSHESYGVKTCGSCHYSQYQNWRAGKHADLARLLTPKYSNNKDCVNCHRKDVEPWNWYTATPELQNKVERVGVACESCHGSALEHVRFTKRYISGPRLGPELEKLARESIRAGQSGTACITCHVRDAHQSHPVYEKTAD